MIPIIILAVILGAATGSAIILAEDIRFFFAEKNDIDEMEFLPNDPLW